MAQARAGRLLALVGLLLAGLGVAYLVVRGEKWSEQEPSRPEAVDSSPATRGTPPTGCAGVAPQAESEAFEVRVVELVNHERAAVALPPLRRVDALSASARWFAREMASQDYFPENHDTYQRSAGQLVRTCDWRTRIGFFYPAWGSLAENIAAGYATPEETVAGWMRSPEHRARILAEGDWETGVGYWTGGAQGHYWVHDFGRRRLPPSGAEAEPETSNGARR
jgi:uncharacterized protein YkwD